MRTTKSVGAVSKQQQGAGANEEQDEKKGGKGGGGGIAAWVTVASRHEQAPCNAALWQPSLSLLAAELDMSEM